MSSLGITFCCEVAGIPLRPRGEVPRSQCPGEQTKPHGRRVQAGAESVRPHGSGYAQIYARPEYYDRALDYSRRALEINPDLDGVRRNMELLKVRIEQRRRQSI